MNPTQKVTTLIRTHWLLVGSILAVIVLRAILLLVTPPGFYLDEAASGAHAIALSTQATNAHGELWPLFSASLGGGYTTPIYLYPLAGWIWLFSASEYALRAFSLAATIGTALLIALTVRLWLNNKTALVASLVALILPWGWVQGSLAWDPALVPLFIAASLYSFSVALKAVDTTRRHIAATLLGVSLVALAYLYPPCRVTAPLLLAALYGILLYKRAVSLKATAILAASLTLLCIPLLQFMLEPAALHRSSELSVFHDTSLIAGVWQIILNFIHMLSPVFLFVTGDANLRHSTGQQGMLGLAALPAIVACIYAGVAWARKRPQQQAWMSHPTILLTIISVLGILLSLLGSALTAEGQPHSLRATAAWPFFVILIAIGWTQLYQKAPQLLKMTAVIVAIGATVWYVYDLAVYYPERSAQAFDVPIRQAIETGQPPANYPALSLDYYDQRSN